MFYWCLGDGMLSLGNLSTNNEVFVKKFVFKTGRHVIRVAGGRRSKANNRQQRTNDAVQCLDLRVVEISPPYTKY